MIEGEVVEILRSQLQSIELVQMDESQIVASGPPIAIVLFASCFQPLPQTSSAQQYALLNECEVTKNDAGQITEVSLQGDTRTIIGKLKSLANMKQSEAVVATITISKTIVTAELINELNQLNKLQCLRIGGEGGAAETFVEKEAYENLSQLQQLLELHIVDAEYHNFGSNRHTTVVSFISSLRKLSILEIDANISADDFQSIASLPSLTEFTYHRSADELPIDSWTKLLHSPKFRSLTLHKIGSRFSPARAFQDPARIGLEFLYVGYVDPKFEWTNDDMSALGNLSKLKTLTLPSSKPISQAQLLALVPCEQVEEVTIFVRDRVNSLPLLRSGLGLRKLAVYAPEFGALEELAAHPTLTDRTLGILPPAPR